MFGMGEKIDSILGSGAEFKGNLNVEGSAVIDGRLEGHVVATGRVTVGPHGSVAGDLSAPEVIVSGRVQGQVYATVRAELMPGAQVDGDLRAPKVVLAEGAVLNGRVIMPSGQSASAAQASPSHAAPKLARK